ncbi:glycosyltransferase (GT2) [Formosa agariphila KMM 3901]|uniref:Glycosyltransferase (GT2) n=1 Tax=Formosa agariphila (strain DSM 15362 / KCTC 12365 / LMG 23005 / KMM 3901 / M-2Alg 35-1) TaxID=1347342 RepID=T2KPW3_FORAG|nr:glycosyltransferase [Formosa agariphila]CDF80862.1 glycosyltransferase (GT2) [Formosa agariphila KMM 3901]
MIIFSLITLTLYTFLIGSLYWGFTKVKTFKPHTHSNETSFSIVIPFRNEAKHLPELLQSISELDYSKNHFEIILINDGSEDISESIVNHFTQTHRELQITLLQNKRHSNSPKKDAISLAISHAQFSWILTTDADCVLPKTWLNTFNAFIQGHPDCQLIVAPVTYFTTSKFLTIFQWFDVMSLQGATVGGFGINTPFLCNGANLGYTKQGFYKVNGFAENDSIASGDDIFLLEKISKAQPESVKYLKSIDAVIYTHAQPTLGDLISQRKRWASKTKAYKNTFSQITGLLVLSMNALWICLFIFMCFEDFSPIYFTIICLVKFHIDFMLIYKSAVFFNQKKHLKWYPVVAILYPIFCSYVAVASLFTSYTWKDRQFAK